MPLDVREIHSQAAQAGSSQSQPCPCPPHAQCCLLSLKPEQSSWGQVQGMLEHHKVLARKRDAHTLMDWTWSTEKVKDKEASLGKRRYCGS